MKVVVSVVSYNVAPLLRECLNDLLKQKGSFEKEIWVIDNDSQDNSYDLVKKEFPNIHLIKSEKNLGFAKGHNQILKKTKGDYFLILNPDTKMGWDVLSKMVGFMEDHPECGISSCKVIDFEGNLQPNGGDLPLGLALLSWLFNLEVFGSLPNFHRTEKEYYEKAHEVGWVSGSFMLIRKEVFLSIGFLDEDYFMYFEDSHFCYLAKKAGFKIMVNPVVRISHMGGASSKDPKFRQWFGEFAGLVKFYKKEFGNLASFAVKLLVNLVIILRIVAFALLGRFNISATYGKILAKV